MRIILTNDDGIDAVGIRLLQKALAEKGHTVALSAPMKNQSAKSHSITIRSSYDVEKRSDKEYAVDGTPADSTIFGLFSGVFDAFKPELVISGINNGYNLSSDILYSGTCGAASEAAMNQYKSIAISAEQDVDNRALLKAAEFIANNLDEIVKKITNYTYININVPVKGDVHDSCISKVVFFSHDNEIRAKNAIEGRINTYTSDVFDSRRYKAVLKEPDEREENLISDCDAVQKGIIAVSLVSVVPRTMSHTLKGIELK